MGFAVFDDAGIAIAVKPQSDSFYHFDITRLIMAARTMPEISP
jgi:hypothetical protein